MQLLVNAKVCCDTQAQAEASDASFLCKCTGGCAAGCLRQHVQSDCRVTPHFVILQLLDTNLVLQSRVQQARQDEASIQWSAAQQRPTSTSSAVSSWRRASSNVDENSAGHMGTVKADIKLQIVINWTVAINMHKAPNAIFLTLLLANNWNCLVLHGKDQLVKGQSEATQSSSLQANPNIPAPLERRWTPVNLCTLS